MGSSRVLTAHSCGKDWKLRERRLMSRATTPCSFEKRAGARQTNQLRSGSDGLTDREHSDPH